MDAKETFDQFLSLFYLHPTSVWEEPDPDAATAFIPLDNGEHAWLVMPHEDDFHSQIGYDRWFATRNMGGGGLNSSESMKTGLKTPSVM